MLSCLWDGEYKRFLAAHVVAVSSLTVWLVLYYMSVSLNTICLRLYGIGHTVKDHSDRERGNPLPSLYGLLFPISSKGSFICTIPHIYDSTYHGLCYANRGALAERNSSTGPTKWNPVNVRQHRERMLYHRAMSHFQSKAAWNITFIYLPSN